MKNKIIWTDYFNYRTKLRGFDKAIIETILRFSTERYFDIATKRNIVIGKHHSKLVLIPYDITEGNKIPVTIHATSRQQINFRLKTGRFVYE
jgi:RNA:NAD 2'-phosphotransferase (TPT1/KptA family)